MIEDRLDKMPNQFINPQSLPPTKGYAHVVVSEGSKIIWISGQVSVDQNGEIVGRESFQTQTEQAFRNVHEALVAIGATFKDVVKLDYYVCGLFARNCWNHPRCSTVVLGGYRTTIKHAHWGASIVPS